jgi:hypothetical protein
VKNFASNQPVKMKRAKNLAEKFTCACYANEMQWKWQGSIIECTAMNARLKQSPKPLQTGKQASKTTSEKFRQQSARQNETGQKLGKSFTCC